MRDGRVPDAQAVAAAAQVGAHDVEAEEGDAIIVVDAGDRRGRRAVELADEESAWIDRGKAGSIGDAGIPPLSGGPVCGKHDLVRPHGADVEAIRRHINPLPLRPHGNDISGAGNQTLNTRPGALSSISTRAP